MTDEVLKLALDALEGFIPYLPLKDKAQCNRYDKAITALRLVIDSQNMASKSTYKEQLETKDEPVAWMNDSTPSGIFARHIEGAKNFGCTIPLYTTPQRTWVGLKDEEIAEVEDEYIVDYRIPAGSAWNFAKDIEAKLKERNT